MYLDREFLRNLVSVEGSLDFNIQVIEYRIQENCSNTNNNSIDPSIENCEANFFENSNKKLEDNHSLSRPQKSNKDCRKRVCLNSSFSTTQSKTVEQKYINIEDITDMKNINFYHNLVEKIRDNSGSRSSHICEETGYLQCLEDRIILPKGNEYGDKCCFFKLNDNYVWYEKQKLCADIKFLSNISCKVNLVGYDINFDENTGKKISKAIAIFLE